MSDKRQRKQLKRRRKLATKDARDRQRRSIFLDAVDSYADEFESLKQNPPVGDLIGIYELSAEHFHSMTCNERLAFFGLAGYEAPDYECELDEAPTSSPRREGHRVRFTHPLPRWSRAPCPLSPQ